MTEELNKKVDQLRLVAGESACTVKLQCNMGKGACFPLHFDNPGRPNSRQVTALFYLNEGWKQGDGGELQLVPFLGDKVDIPPTFDRLVLFLSDRVLHRTLPAWAIRRCFTIWLDGDAVAVNQDDDVFLKAKHLQAVQDDRSGGGKAVFGHSPLQRVLSRSVYAEEYVNQSINHA
jgi:hypothetical protein